MTLSVKESDCPWCEIWICRHDVDDTCEKYIYSLKSETMVDMGRVILSPF